MDAAVTAWSVVRGFSYSWKKRREWYKQSQNFPQHPVQDALLDEIFKDYCISYTSESCVLDVLFNLKKNTENASWLYVQLMWEKTGLMVLVPKPVPMIKSLYIRKWVFSYINLATSSHSNQSCMSTNTASEPQPCYVFAICPNLVRPPKHFHWLNPRSPPNVVSQKCRACGFTLACSIYPAKMSWRSKPSQWQMPKSSVN